MKNTPIALIDIDQYNNHGAKQKKATKKVA